MIETDWAWNGLLNRRGGTEYLVLHHAAGNGSAEAIHQTHLAKGWIGIGYHYYVRKDGSIYRGRPEDRVGAHTVGYNHRSIGVCFEGNFEAETMSEPQLKAGRWLIADILSRYPGLKAVGHRELDATACPGKNFPFAELMEKEEEKLDVSAFINSLTDEQPMQLVPRCQAAIMALRSK